jgi:subtilisin
MSILVGPLRPGQHGRRRYAFLTLLLLALAAPAGWVAAGQATAPYVVVFRDEAVTVPDTAADEALSGVTLGFLDAARAPNMAPSARAANGAKVAPDGNGRRRVDGGRVEAHIRDLASRTGMRDVDDVYSSAVGGFSARLTASQTAAIAADPAVAAVLPDEPVSLDEGAAGLGGTVRTTSNPPERIQPGVRRVGARSPQVAALTSNGVRINADVAIIDTGIQRDHPDLNVVGGYNCTGRDRTKWDDKDGHGTHVAGIVGALDNRIGVTGVAPGVRLWAVKVLDENGHGFLSWVVCGVDWVSAQRDQNSPSRPLIEVANMSLSFSLPGGNDAACGTLNNDTLHEAICRSVDKGTVYVVAAGNESHNARRNRPAAYDEVITVSAMADYDGRGGGHAVPSDSCPYWSPEPDDAFTSFSNYGPDVDLIAPGKCVLSTYLNGRYAWMSGTSMATPHVTGAAVIYRTMFPHATPQQVEMGLEAVGTLDWRTATDPDQSHERAVWIGQFRVIPDFSMSASLASGTVPPGGTLPVDVSLLRVGGFNAAVTVSLDSPPAGVSMTPVVSRGDSASLMLRIASGTRLGRYSVTVRAASGSLVHESTITIIVAGVASQTAFVSPRSDLTVQASTTVPVAWTERASTTITGRRLDRQVGSVRTPGTCAGVEYTLDLSRTNATELTEQLRSGLCYRWQLTLTDSAGYRSTVYSGAVLIDATPPRTPTVELAGSSSTPDLNALGVDQIYVSNSGTLWVRSGVTGSVPVQVNANDPESGIARNVATVNGGSGWRVEWVGSSADGSLRLYFATQGAGAQLDISSVNGAGLAGPTTDATLLRDSSAPSPGTWVSAPSGSTRTVHGPYFRLAWTGGSDTGSGLADLQVVARYRAPLAADGTCRTNSFAPDGGFRLASDNSWDSGLEPGSCYVWSLRTLDNVGHTSAVTVSGYVITSR